MAAPEPDWLRIQKVVFKRYVAQKLKAAGNNTPVNDLLAELKSTNLLIDFAEALSSKAFAGKKPTPSAQKIQQMNNATIALKFVKESCGVSTQTSAENIVDGNEKLILGMIFQIILKFMKIEDEDGNVGSDVKEALMLWLKNRTAGYNNCNITDFTKSFHNGLPFCALIHKMRPKLLNYDSLNPGSKLDNIALALDLGEKYMNVPKYLAPEDIAHMDEVGMIVYLSDWYYGVALLQKQDVAARRIGKVIAITQLHDSMRAQYNNGAAELIKWSDSTIASLNQRNFENSVEGVQRQIAEFFAYKKGDKAAKIGQLLDLQSLFDDLAVRLAHNKRPAFTPASSPDSVEKKLAEVDAAELERSKALHAELARQIEIVNDGICKQFADAVQAFQSWLSGKKASIQGDKSQTLEQQLAAVERNAADLQSGYDGLIAPIHQHAKRIEERSITHNKFTPLTAGDCEASFKQLLLVVDKKKTLLKHQIEEAKKAGLTDEQQAEIRDNFNHFDRNKTNDIDRRELRACLQSLGQDATPKDVDAVFAKFAPGATKLTFEQFKAFMTEKLGDSDSKDEIINSFRLIALEKEVVLPAQLSALINEMSWKQKHVDYLNKEMKPKDGGLDYDTWSDEVFKR